MRVAIQIAVLCVFASASGLEASTFSFSTPSAAKDVGAGNPLDASALFVISSNGGTNNVLTITLTNLLNNPAEDGQVLDALTFQLANQSFNAGATIAITSSISEAISVNSNGTFTPASNCKPGNTSGCSTFTTNWKTTATVTGTSATFNLCDAHITSIGCTNTFTAKDGIIGGPDPHTGVYDNPNSNGNPTSPNNPYIFETMVFTAKISSGGGSFTLPANYTADIQSLEFGFGQDGTDVTTEAGVAPEPSSIALFGLALLAGGIALRYRQRRARIISVQ
jgi:hypothetical protein